MRACEEQKGRVCALMQPREVVRSLPQREMWSPLARMPNLHLLHFLNPHRTPKIRFSNVHLPLKSTFAPSPVPVQAFAQLLEALRSGLHTQAVRIAQLEVENMALHRQVCQRFSYCHLPIHQNNSAIL